jgi:hypothetical protein
MRSIEEEWQRRRAARVDSILLQVQAVLAGAALGVLAAAPPPPGPFSVALTASGLVVLAVLSSFGSFVEWNRDKLGEAFALAAGALGILMALVGA